MLTLEVKNIHGEAGLVEKMVLMRLNKLGKTTVVVKEDVFWRRGVLIDLLDKLLEARSEYQISLENT